MGLVLLIFQAWHRAFEMLESEDMTVVVQAVVLLLWHLVMNEMAWVVGEVAALPYRALLDRQKSRSGDSIWISVG